MQTQIERFAPAMGSKPSQWSHPEPVLNPCRPSMWDIVSFRAQGDGVWYAICTSEVTNGGDKHEEGIYVKWLEPVEEGAHPEPEGRYTMTITQEFQCLTTVNDWGAQLLHYDPETQHFTETPAETTWIEPDYREDPKLHDNKSQEYKSMLGAASPGTTRSIEEYELAEGLLPSRTLCYVDTAGRPVPEPPMACPPSHQEHRVLSMGSPIPARRVGKPAHRC